MWCDVRGGNVEMSTVYLVLGYAHCNTAVFQSTQPTVKWTCSVVSSWEAAAEQDKQVLHTEEKIHFDFRLKYIKYNNFTLCSYCNNESSSSNSNTGER